MARKKSLDEGRVPREEILQRASLLFYERGYGATSIRDIAEAAGLSSSTMYHHFASKQDCCTPSSTGSCRTSSTRPSRCCATGR